MRSSLSTKWPACSTSISSASKALGASGTGLPSRIQQTLPSVEAKRTEAVEMSCFLVHSPGKEFFKISSRFRKDF
jgi:hypothetical protein